MPITKTSVKKDGLQQYRVRVNFTDAAGNHRQIERTAYGKDAARNLEQALLAEVKKKPVLGAPETVKDLYEAFLAAREGEMRATSQDKTGRDIRLHVLPILGDDKLSRLTTARLQEWKTECAKLNVAITTKQNWYISLNSMLHWGVKMGFLPENPITKVGNFRDPNFGMAEEKKKIQYYTSEEYQKFIAEAKKDHDRRYYVFFSIAFFTGMRKGEINALKWSDIYDGTIHVSRSVTQKLKGEDVITPPKNAASVRDIQMPEPLKKILAEHRANVEKVYGESESMNVCGGEKCLRDTSIDKRNTAYAKAAGLHHIRIHDFRHTHASLLINEGISIQEIARRLGHANVEITWRIYAHLYPREEDRALRILNGIEG